MGASLGPVLANIILIELERDIVKPLIDSDVLKFYVQYVDDTLVLEKPENLHLVLDKLNSFHPNLKKMRPITAHVSRAHGTPKIYKKVWSTFKITSHY